MVGDSVIEQDIEEEYGDMVEDTPDVAETLKLKHPKDVPKPQKEDKDYSAIIEDSPELKQYLEYTRIKKKFEAGQPLTQKEAQFKVELDKAVVREKEVEEIQERTAQEQQAKQKQIQEEIMREYQATKNKSPEKILKVSELEITLSGGESIPKLLSFVFAMKKARKKGGKVLVQVFRSRKVMVKWTNKDISFVEFYTTDEKGNELMEVTRFSEYPYSFEGTPIPVLFAVQGYAEGFDFFSEFRKDLSSEMVNRLITRSFHAGYMKGAEVSQPKKKNDFLASLLEFTPIICIAGFFVVGYLVYTMSQDNKVMLESVLAMKNTLAVQFPDVNSAIDFNGIVLGR